jgi:hypothetical protein
MLIQDHIFYHSFHPTKWRQSALEPLPHSTLLIIRNQRTISQSTQGNTGNDKKLQKKTITNIGHLLVQLNIQILRSDRSMCLLRQFPYNYNFTPQLHVGLRSVLRYFLACKFCNEITVKTITRAEYDVILLCAIVQGFFGRTGRFSVH